MEISLHWLIIGFLGQLFSLQDLYYNGFIVKLTKKALYR